MPAALPPANVADDQIADVVDRRALVGLRAHQHVDLAIAEAVARRHRTAHLVHDLIGDLLRRQAERSGALLIEVDLDFGIAAFDRRLHVGEARRCVHQRGQFLAGLFQRSQVVAAQFDFQRRGKAEKLRTRELHFACRRASPSIARNASVAARSPRSPTPGFNTISRRAMFSPDSVGVASSRVPVPLTP